MKKLIFLFLVFISIGLQAQQSGYATDLDELYFKTKVVQKFDSTVPVEERISGSPFLDKGFKISQIIFVNGDTLMAMMRYNCHTDELHFMNNEDEFVLNPTNSIAEFYLGNLKFVYFVPGYVDSNPKGYYQMHYQGKNTILLKKYTVKFFPKTPDRPVIGVQPARYGSVEEQYYLLTNGNFSKIKLSRKNIIAAFPDKKDEITKLIKTNKLDLDEVDDVAKLMTILDL